MKTVIKSGKATPQDAVLIMTYMLAKALAISPLEIQKMPATMVRDLLAIHYAVEVVKAEEMEKTMKKALGDNMAQPTSAQLNSVIIALGSMNKLLLKNNKALKRNRKVLKEYE